MLASNTIATQAPAARTIQLAALADVAAVLRGVPDESFGSGTWFACGVGHYVRQRPKCGLKLSKMGKQPEFFGLYDWDAVQAYFEITEDEAFHLFDEEIGRLEMIERIESFVASHA